MTKYIHSGNQFRTLSKNSSLYFISSLVTKASYFVLMPIMTRLLSLDDYGLVANLQAIIRLSAVFVSLYIDSAFNRFYFENNSSKGQLQKYISSFFWFIVIWGSFVTVILLVVGKVYLTRLYSIQFFPLIFLTAISPLFMQISIPGKFHLRSNLKTRQIVIPNLLIIFLSTGISLFLMMQLEMGIYGRFIGIFSSNFFACLYFSFFLIKNGLITFRIDKEVIWTSLKFSLPLLPLAMSSWVATLSDRIILTFYVNTAEAGLYDVAYKISQGIRIFTESVFQVYSPVMLSMYTFDKNEFNVKLGRFATYFIWVMFFVAFFASIFSKELLTLFTAPAYHSAYTLIPIIIFGYFISGQSKYLGTVFTLRKVTYLSTVGYFLQALVNLVLNLILIPVMGKVAAAWSTFASLVFLTLWSGFWFLKWENVQFEWGKIVRILITGLVAFVSYLVTMRLFHYGDIVMLILKGVATVPIVVVLSFYFDVIDFKRLKMIFSLKKKLA